MKNYELTVLVHPDAEADLDSVLETVRGLVTTNGGSIIKEDAWGKKKLAYQIDKQHFAMYHYLEVALPPAAPLAISNALNITDNILRYLLVKTDEKARQAAEARRKNSSEEE